MINLILSQLHEESQLGFAESKTKDYALLSSSLRFEPKHHGPLLLARNEIALLLTAYTDGSSIDQVSSPHRKPIILPSTIHLLIIIQKILKELPGSNGLTGLCRISRVDSKARSTAKCSRYIQSCQAS
jgi:hypothetical protein